MQDLVQGSISGHVARHAAFIFATMLFQTLHVPGARQHAALATLALQMAMVLWLIRGEMRHPLAALGGTGSPETGIPASNRMGLE